MWRPLWTALVPASGRSRKLGLDAGWWPWLLSQWGHHRMVAVAAIPAEPIFVFKQAVQWVNLQTVCKVQLHAICRQTGPTPCHDRSSEGCAGRWRPPERDIREFLMSFYLCRAPVYQEWGCERLGIWVKPVGSYFHVDQVNTENWQKLANPGLAGLSLHSAASS